MNRRRLLLIAAIWLATVITGSTATWAVISATGTKVGQTIPLSAPASMASTHSAVPTSTPSSQPTQTPSATASTSSKPNTKPTQSRPSTTKTATQTIRGSWSGEAGTVTASCTGSAISLVSAVPAVGYRVHVEREGTRELEIEFESAAGEEHEAHLKASCAGGTPSFRTA